MSSPDWEAICLRCGRCCYEKIDFEGRIYYTDLPCQFLDLEIRTCKVYPSRHRHRPDCAKLTPELVGMGLLPCDCPYVAGVPDYQAPLLWEEDEESS